MPGSTPQTASRAQQIPQGRGFGRRLPAREALADIRRCAAADGRHFCQIRPPRGQPGLTFATIGRQQRPSRTQLFVHHRGQRPEIIRLWIAGQHDGARRLPGKLKRTQHLRQGLRRIHPLPAKRLHAPHCPIPEIHPAGAGTAQHRVEPQEIQGRHRAWRGLRAVVILLQPRNDRGVVRPRVEIAASIGIPKKFIHLGLQLLRPLQPPEFE